MLARTLDLNALATYTSNPGWYMEQKLDGIRLLIKIEDGNITAANRRGETITLNPNLIPSFDGFSGDWIFDGEWVGDTFWVFDMPKALHLVTPSTPFIERRKALEAIAATAWEDNQQVKIVDVARTKAQKVTLLKWCAENHSEGVLLKIKSGTYDEGMRRGRIYRSEGMLKAKFTETVDCIITEVGREGKASCAVSLYHHGHLLDVGSCKMTEANLSWAKVGDVAELRYLYATADLRLYQPRFIRFRDDKNPEECDTDQLKVTNKTVLRKAY